MTPYLAATCDKARAGWPCDEEMEALRDKYVRADTPAEKKAAAEEVQRHFVEIVTHVPLGEWVARLGGALQHRDPRGAAAGHRLLGHYEKVTTM